MTSASVRKPSAFSFGGGGVYVVHNSTMFYNIFHETARNYKSCKKYVRRHLKLFVRNGIIFNELSCGKFSHCRSLPSDRAEQ